MSDYGNSGVGELSSVGIAAIRARAQQDLVEPPIYRIFRMVSPYFSIVFMAARLTPNSITAIWTIALVAAAFCFAANIRVWSLIGCALLALYYTLDCCDGEVARTSGTSSAIGSQFEQIAHWFTNGLLLVGISFGARHEVSPGILVLICGMAVLGDYCFHFVYFQLNLLFRREVNYGPLHGFTRVLYKSMPINTNILLIAGLLHWEFQATIAWALLSNLLWPTALFLFFRVERLQPPRGT
jgi:phosphatidylglycerophosphate synthase